MNLNFCCCFVLCQSLQVFWLLEVLYANFCGLTQCSVYYIYIRKSPNLTKEISARIQNCLLSISAIDWISTLAPIRGNSWLFGNFEGWFGFCRFVAVLCHFVPIQHQDGRWSGDSSSTEVSLLLHWLFQIMTVMILSTLSTPSFHFQICPTQRRCLFCRGHQTSDDASPDPEKYLWLYKVQVENADGLDKLIITTSRPKISRLDCNRWQRLWTTSLACIGRMEPKGKRSRGLYLR